MHELFENQSLMFDERKKLTFLNRRTFESILFDNQATGLVGPRGVGKTTFLLHRCMALCDENQPALYVSADHLYFINHSLIDLVDQLYKETDIRYLLIDEIHKYPNWNQELKNICDTYLSFKIIFTGSSTIDLISSRYDLSRRVTLHHLSGLSFREYLEFHHDITLPRYTLDALLFDTKATASIQIPGVLKLFNEYLNHGYYPFLKFLKSGYAQKEALENAVQKTIYEDIGSSESLKTPTLRVIEQLYQYVLHSQPGELNASKLSTILNKDFNAISHYLALLNKAGLVRFLHTKQTGKAMLKNPIKLYPENTNMIALSQRTAPHDLIIGKMRETFALSHLQNAQCPVYYSKTADLMIDDTIIEIGGKNKSCKQIKESSSGFIFADGIVTRDKSKLPLFWLGLLY